MGVPFFFKSPTLLKGQIPVIRSGHWIMGNKFELSIDEGIPTLLLQVMEQEKGPPVCVQKWG